MYVFRVFIILDCNDNLHAVATYMYMFTCTGIHCTCTYTPVQYVYIVHVHIIMIVVVYNYYPRRVSATCISSLFEYRIAGNFRGTKYSWFSNLETFRG